jgi:hypothetical protein
MFCLDLLHGPADLVGDLDRVRAGRLEDRDGDGLLVVEQRAQRVFGGAELDAGDVAQARHRAIRAVLMMMSPNSSSLCRRPCALTDSCRSTPGRIRRGADHAGGGLDVLGADLVDDIAGRKAVLGHLLRIEPDAHRIVAGAEQLDLADAVDARQPVLDVEHGVVAQIGHVVAAVRRQQVHDHGQVGRALDRGHAEAAHFFRQPRLGLADAVLDQLLCLVGVGAELEGDSQRHHAVGRRLAAHVEHVLDAVDLLLDRRRHGLGNDFRIGAGIVARAPRRSAARHRDIPRSAGSQRDQAGEEDHDGQTRRRRSDDR